MDKFLTFVGAVVVVPLILIFACILGTLFGAIGGWVVGWFFGDTILGVLASFGVTGLSMWQYGAFLGFTGAFFRAHQTNSK